MGRARRADRRRADRDRRDQRRQRRRDQRASSTPLASPRAAARARARSWKSSGCRSRQRARSRRRSAGSSTPGSSPGARPARQRSCSARWADAVSQFVSPYAFNPFNINPLRAHLAAAVDFERLRAGESPKLFVAATNVRTGRGEIFRRDVLTADHIMASCLPAAAVPGGRDRARGLLGRRLCRQSAALAAVLRDQVPRHRHRPDQPDRARRNPAHAGGHRQPAERDHLQRQPSRRTARRRLRRPPHPLGHSQQRRATGSSACTGSAAPAGSKVSRPRPSSTSPGPFCGNCATWAAPTRRPGSRRISTRSASKAPSTSTGRSSASRRRTRSAGCRRRDDGRRPASVQFRGRAWIFNALGVPDCNFRGPVAAI